ncbi:MAG: GIY-YIG nuclease family protein [Nitrospirae bacterium]|nr:GIY-YIG nuclease family protein [Nitrospirota bacterium]
MFVVYVLYRPATDQIYTGRTAELPRRIAEHNQPRPARSKFTHRGQGRWWLIHSENLPTSPEAARRRRQLKSGVGRAWIRSTFLHVG